MKIPFPLPVAVCLLVLIGPAGAENPGAPPAPESRRIIRPAPINVDNSSTPAASAEQEKKLTRFDLDFPGGTPAQLAAAISKATGKHLNLIIPTEVADVKIMPLKIDGVTVPYLFAAIRRASTHRILVGPPERSEYRDVMTGFSSDGPISDETVWSFFSTAPTAEELARLAKVVTPSMTTRYFQLAPYLENYSIEDVTTAIQTGWKMAKVDPLPQLSFHKETSLLISVGPEASVKLIPDVLGQLRRDRGPAVERIVTLQRQLDDDIAKNQGRKSTEIREQISRIAQEQKANETIENPNRVWNNQLVPPPR